MDDLIQWLRAQLDADQRDAEARRGIFPQPGVDDDGVVWLHVRPGGNAVLVRQRDPIAGYDDLAKLKSWADTENGWTQERVLREIDAKRQITREWEDAKRTAESDPSDASARVALLAFEITLRLHAAVYDARPGYREEWRP
ncbi:MULTISPECIES: DUF6221 family protein [Actinomycetes]|uniref:DUF6221 family protein n=1 Tax=Actinomycetes TaxID=1760 RepID=UPI003408FA0B